MIEWKTEVGLGSYESLTLGAFDIEVGTGTYVEHHWFTIWCVDQSHEDSPRTVVFSSSSYSTREEAKAAALAKMRELLNEAIEAMKQIATT